MSGGRHYLIHQDCSLQTPPWVLTRVKSCQSFKFLTPSAGMYMSIRTYGGLPLPKIMCVTEALTLNMLGEYYFFLLYSISFSKMWYDPSRWLYNLICRNYQFIKQEIQKIKINILSHTPESIIDGLHSASKYSVNCFIK